MFQETVAADMLTGLMGGLLGAEVGEDRVLAEDTVPGPGPHTGD